MTATVETRYLRGLQEGFILQPLPSGERLLCFEGSPLGRTGAGCEHGNGRREAAGAGRSRPQGGRGKHSTRWRAARPHYTGGCGGGAASPTPRTNRAATRPQAGAGHNIVIRSARGRPRAACAFCITPVMLNRQSRFTLRPANPRPLCLTAGRPAWADRRQAQSTTPIPPTASTLPSLASRLSSRARRLSLQAA